MSEENDFDFENEIAIDLDNLHEEWRTHSSIRYKYASEISHLDRVVKKAHEHVKVTRSRLIREAKGAKLSSADLREGYYREHEDHISAKNEQIDAEYDLSMAWNALNAFDDRKNALENEVKLWIRNYFSAPTEERQIEPGKGIAAKGRDEASGKARETMNRKRTRA